MGRIVVRRVQLGDSGNEGGSRVRKGRVREKKRGKYIRRRGGTVSVTDLRPESRGACREVA